MLFYGGDGKMSNGHYYALVAPICFDSSSSEKLELVVVPIGVDDGSGQLTAFTTTTEYYNAVRERCVEGGGDWIEVLKSAIKGHNPDRLVLLTTATPTRQSTRRQGC